MTSASTYFGGFTGGYTIMKDYVRARRQSTREAFVPLHHPVGHAQVDFGEAAVELQGQPEKIAFFCLILPHSDVWFVKAYPRGTTEAFLNGHVNAFALLGGIPRAVLHTCQCSSKIDSTFQALLSQQACFLGSVFGKVSHRRIEGSRAATSTATCVLRSHCSWKG